MMNDEATKDYFNYLEDLRQSGETNMFGAGPYLRKEFGLSRKESHDILDSWMSHKEQECRDEYDNIWDSKE